MSDVGKTGADASVVSDVVADDKTAVAATDTAAVEGAEDAETEAEEGAETAIAEETAAEAAETDADDKPTKSKLRREKQKARIEALEAEVRRLSEQSAAVERNKPTADALGAKPDRASYEDEAEYVADLAAYRAEERSLARQEKTHTTDTATARANAAEANVKLFRERALALADTYPDIEAKVFNDQTLPMSPVMAETLMASEKGPEVAYYLSSHREEAASIKSMSPLAAAAALGRLEAKLSLPKTRTETKAPPPPATVSGSVRGPARKLEDMDMAEYRKARGFA